MPSISGHYERPPYDNDALRSAYHTRSLEVFRLKQVIILHKYITRILGLIPTSLSSILLSTFHLNDFSISYERIYDVGRVKTLYLIFAKVVSCCSH